MITVTDATVEQAPLVHRIMLDAFAEYLGILDPPSGAHAETVEDVIAAMDQGGAVIAWENGDAIGSGRWRMDEGSVYIGRISVLPAYRGRGAAHAMLMHMERIARERGFSRTRLGVRVLLPQNIELYQKVGYVITEKITHPKGNAEVVFMEKKLTAENTEKNE